MYANRTAGSTALKRLMTEYRGMNLVHVVLYKSNIHSFFLELTLNAPEGITAGLLFKDHLCCLKY